MKIEEKKKYRKILKIKIKKLFLYTALKVNQLISNDIVQNFL